jgi:ATP-binding cassette subfamily B multidrug efflux pump
MDDSTSAVDTKTDAKIENGFRSYLPHTTKIVIAQRITSVENCDSIIVMDDGKIVAQGKHEDLIKNCSIYADIYQSQQKGDSDNGKGS